MCKRLVALVLVTASVSLMALEPAPKSDSNQQVTTDIGPLVAGWKFRLDNPEANLATVKAAEMDGGLHLVVGATGTLYKLTNVAKGDFHLQATFIQSKRPARHPEAYGIFVGGNDLEGWKQKYTMFLIRDDAKFSIARRIPNPTSRYYPVSEVHRTLLPWKQNTIVKRMGADGTMTNTLAITAAGDTVTFFVNGKAVSKYPRDQVDADGVFGIRVSHDLEVRFTDLALSDVPAPPPIEGWDVESRESSVASLKSIRADNWMRITIEGLPKPGASHVRLRRGQVPVTAGHRYRLSFFMRADAVRPVSCGVASAGAPGTTLGATTEVKAETWWKEFNCPFTATGTDPNAVVFLDLGASEAGVEFSNVQLRNLTTGTVVMSTDPAWRPPAIKLQ